VTFGDVAKDSGEQEIEAYAVFISINSFVALLVHDFSLPVFVQGNRPLCELLHKVEDDAPDTGMAQQIVFPSTSQVAHHEHLDVAHDALVKSSFLVLKVVNNEFKEGDLVEQISEIRLLLGAVVFEAVEK